MSKERLFPEYLQLEVVNDMGKGCMLEHLGIEVTDIGEQHMTASMPVDHRTKQPMGLLHGGASVALAESLGSFASAVIIDLSKYAPVGLEINANHVKAVKSGNVYGTVTPIHIGKRTHVWSIEIKNDENQLVAISRLTVAIIENK